MQTLFTYRIALDPHTYMILLPRDARIPLLNIEGLFFTAFVA